MVEKVLLELGETLGSRRENGSVEGRGESYDAGEGLNASSDDICAILAGKLSDERTLLRCLLFSFHFLFF